jgi:hypothetical protein
VQSAGNGDRYRELLREHGHVLWPGGEGYEEGSVNLPCGWPGPQPGRIVRETWVKWAREQPEPKDSWLVPWEDLDKGQREVDARIEAAVRVSERERLAQIAGTEAAAGERARLLAAARSLKHTLFRPGCGNGQPHDEAFEVVPREAIEKLLGGGDD